MKDFGSVMVPVLMIAGWLGIALATTVQLASMGGTLTAIESAEQARQVSRDAPRVASVATRATAE